jgi:hypothetical protein
VTHVHGIALAAEQVIGGRQRDEAFRMFGRRENAVGVVDADGLIQGRVENEQRLLQTGYSLDQALPRQIVEKFASDPKRPACEYDFCLAAGVDFGDAIFEKANRVGGIGWGRDGDHGARFRHLGGGCQHRSPAEAVPDEECRRTVGPPQVVPSVDWLQLPGSGRGFGSSTILMGAGGSEASFAGTALS